MRKGKEIKPGERFGKLVVLRSVGNDKGNYLYECRCDCGNTTIARKSNLNAGCTKSCGCIRKAVTGKLSYTHGLSKTRLHGIWRGMKERCFNSRDRSYKNYGGRGITMCDDWKNSFISFYNWSMSNGYSDNLSIDRINVNGNYEPSNCRWANVETQVNNKRTTHFITYQGETMSATQWAKRVGLSRKTIINRIETYHWSIEDAFTLKIGEVYGLRKYRRNKATV